MKSGISLILWIFFLLISISITYALTVTFNVGLQPRIGKNNSANVIIKLQDRGLYDFYAFNKTTNYNGEVELELPGGTYDITIKPNYYLRKKQNNIAININTYVDFGNFSPGDFNNDNKVNFQDIGQFSACYGKNTTLNPECKKADFNDDGKVNALDIGPFSANYGKTGDEELVRPKIVFVSDRDGNKEIYTMDIDGNDVRRLTYNSAEDTDPAWSPDGTRIAFTSNRDGNKEIYLMNANGSNQTRLTISNTLNCLWPCAYSFEPAWSPDGSKMVFASGWDDQIRMQKVSNLFILDLSQGTIVQFTDGPYSGYWPSSDTDRYPSWSPDENKIVFYSTKPEPHNGIIVKPVYGGSAYKALGINYSDAPADVDWSPFGEYFVYSTKKSNIHLVQVNPQTGIPVGDPSWIAQGSSPSWSPSEWYISFSNNSEIYTFSFFFYTQTRLTDNSYADIYPDWAPYLG